MAKFTYKGDTESLVSFLQHLNEWQDVVAFVESLSQTPWHGYMIVDDTVVEYRASESPDYGKVDATDWITESENVIYTMYNKIAEDVSGYNCI